MNPRHPRAAKPGARSTLFGVLTAAAAAGLAAGYLRLPIRMEQVQVSGLTRLSREEVVRMIGMEPGTLMGPADARRVAMNLARRPPFAAVAVSRGLTGILHVHVTEREPVAWCQRAGCAVAADGVLLPHLPSRGPGWIGLDGLAVAQGRVGDARLVGEALVVKAALAAQGAEVDGVLRRTAAGSWEWQNGGKRVTLSSPPQPGELARLARFQRSFPDAWARARALDLRFADRVVVSR